MPVPGNAALSDQDKADRADACYWPYHEACAAVIDGVEARGDKVPPVIMMHSFTPVMGQAPRPWEIGILWDRDGRMALPLLHVLRNRGDLCVGDNEPYSGASPHGYSMPTHAARAGRANIQMEIRQDCIADEAGIARWSHAKTLRLLGQVDAALAELLALVDHPLRQNNPAQGYTHEEIGECLLLLGRSRDGQHVGRRRQPVRQVAPLPLQPGARVAGQRPHVQGGCSRPQAADEVWVPPRQRLRVHTSGGWVWVRVGQVLAEQPAALCSTQTHSRAPLGQQ